jgi:hypothetical protein
VFRQSGEPRKTKTKFWHLQQLADWSQGMLLASAKSPPRVPRAVLTEPSPMDGMETSKSPVIEIKGFVTPFEKHKGYTLRLIKLKACATPLLPTQPRATTVHRERYGVSTRAAATAHSLVENSSGLLACPLFRRANSLGLHHPHRVGIPYSTPKVASISTTIHPMQKRRILTLDGGGVRGVFSMEILLRIEQLLREHFKKPDYRLCDHFDFFAGTSAGAILATFLAWGESVESLKQLYLERTSDMFARAPIKEWIAGRYHAHAISDFLRSYFSEDDAARSPALMGTAKLKALLLIVLRNASKGSAWPLTNNPEAIYNRSPSLADGSPNPECNLNLPLWQLVRGSTAAPWYFPPETIRVGAGKKYQFVDGGLTPYNNPALIAFLTATLPSYCLGWQTGVENLRLVSIGMGRFRSRINPRIKDRVPLIRHIKAVPSSLMETIGLQQDMVCRVFGHCEFGEPIDTEVGDLTGNGIFPLEEKKFAYVRYNKFFSLPEIRRAEKIYKCAFGLDALKLIPFLQETGKDYALENVKIEHLL